MELKTVIWTLIISIPFLLCTIMALSNVLQKEFKTIRQKILWGIIASVPFIGFIIYFIFGFRKGKKIN